MRRLIASWEEIKVCFAVENRPDADFAGPSGGRAAPLAGVLTYKK